MKRSLATARPADVCLVMRTPLARYPPSINQGRLLAERGYRVCVLDIDDGGHVAGSLPPEIPRYVLARGIYPWSYWRRLNLFVSRYSRFVFHRNLAQVLRQCAPRLVIAYESPAMSAVHRLCRSGRVQKPLTICHFHELPLLPPWWLRGTRADMVRALRYINDSDLVLFPDRGRLEEVSRTTIFKTETQVVMNCPRRLDTVPVPRLRGFLGERGVAPSEQLVVFCGSISWPRGLLEVVQGMKQWPERASLVLVGPANGEFLERLLVLARQTGVGHRVHAVGPAPASDLLALQAGADVALTIVKPTDLNKRISAGASNKRFEAMAVAVPQVCDQLPGVREIVEQTGSGICVPHDDVRAIGEAITSLLNHPERRKAMGAKAREAHLQRFNYEAQFEPVLERVSTWLRK
jgi:glycosyltransferase involved in cell wall biosynthesis